MMQLTIGLLSFYVIVITRLLIIWRKIPSPVTTPSNVFVSVIIPVRNEQNRIAQTILSILESEFPKGQFEIIVVDDHSADNTAKRVSEIKSSNLKYVKLETVIRGKKAAITKGIELASGELIICTDGDTMVSQHWIGTHLSAYASGNVLAFGMVNYTGRSFFTDMLNLELSSLVAVGGAMISLGQASMINGCNYSFSKKVFKEVHGFEGNESLATGDDEFLLRKIHRLYPKEVAFLKGKSGSVETEPVTNFREFFHQRRRWASKWKHHKGFYSKVAPVLVFLFYLVFYTGVVAVCYGEPVLSATLIIIKLLVDYAFVKSVIRENGVNMKVLPFLALQIIYPFYAVFFGLASNFGQYHWKGRNHQI